MRVNPPFAAIFYMNLNAKQAEKTRKKQIQNSSEV